MSSNPINIAYKNASQDRDYNLYTEEYFGGADTQIYIGDQLYDNIAAISFEVRETVKPIYGYSSRIYDDIAVGTRIVQGMIRIPVKNEGRQSEFVTNENSGYYSLYNDGTANVPDWVYKFVPDKTGNDSYTINTNNDRGMVADIQSRLRMAGKNVDVTGVIDFPTKMAIAEYKKENNLVVNSNCDTELKNRLNNNSENVVYSRKTVLRYSPDNSSQSICEVPLNSRLLVQDYLDNDWILVQIDKGLKGYVKRGEVYV